MVKKCQVHLKIIIFRRESQCWWRSEWTAGPLLLAPSTWSQRQMSRLLSPRRPSAFQCIYLGLQIHYNHDCLKATEMTSFKGPRPIYSFSMSYTEKISKLGYNLVIPCRENWHSKVLIDWIMQHTLKLTDSLGITYHWRPGHEEIAISHRDRPQLGQGSILHRHCTSFLLLVGSDCHYGSTILSWMTSP